MLKNEATSPSEANHDKLKERRVRGIAAPTATLNITSLANQTHQRYFHREQIEIVKDGPDVPILNYDATLRKVKVNVKVYCEEKFS